MKRFTSESVKNLQSLAVRKKPVVVRAIEMNEPFETETLEGVLQGKAGDFLIIGTRGEVYPIARTIFEETYEIVKDERSQQHEK